MTNRFADDEEDNEEETDSKDKQEGTEIIKIEVFSDEKNYLCQLLYDYGQNAWINASKVVFDHLFSSLSKPKDLSNDLQDTIHTLDNLLTENGLSLKDLVEVIGKANTPFQALSNFLTYRPTEHYLRRSFETPIFPLGVHGEGLLKFLKESAEEKKVGFFNELNNGLRLLDWFDGIRIPENLMKNEYKLSIGDKFLSDSLHFFDQSSTNEGFLFLLFYLTLFNSSNTPPFFAIDNIESALNPKLVTKLTEYLVERSFHNNKQVIVTTHSPYVLDGLDLKNPDVRLFVARRDIDGHTRIERIPYREDRTMKLSQLWMSGLIGGLPDNF